MQQVNLVLHYANTAQVITCHTVGDKISTKFIRDCVIRCILHIGLHSEDSLTIDLWFMNITQFCYSTSSMSTISWTKWTPMNKYFSKWARGNNAFFCPCFVYNLPLPLSCLYFSMSFASTYAALLLVGEYRSTDHTEILIYNFWQLIISEFLLSATFIDNGNKGHWWACQSH